MWTLIQTLQKSVYIEVHYYMETALYPVRILRIDVLLAAHRALKQSQSAPTPPQSSELGCAVGTVPSVPRKLASALLSPTLRAHLHAPRIGEIGLRERQRQLVGLLNPVF